MLKVNKIALPNIGGGKGRYMLAGAFVLHRYGLMDAASDEIRIANVEGRAYSGTDSDATIKSHINSENMSMAATMIVAAGTVYQSKCGMPVIVTEKAYYLPECPPTVWRTVVKEEAIPVLKMEMIGYMVRVRFACVYAKGWKKANKTCPDVKVRTDHGVVIVEAYKRNAKILKENGRSTEFLLGDLIAADSESLIPLADITCDEEPAMDVDVDGEDEEDEDDKEEG